MIGSRRHARKGAQSKIDLAGAARASAAFVVRNQGAGSNRDSEAAAGTSGCTPGL